ncbi:MAG: TolC family protein [Candidatus Brocadiia bacterium]
MLKRMLTAGFCVGCVGLLVAAGCSRQYYRQRADREVYGIIEQKTPAVPDMPEEFTIEHEAQELLRDCPTLDLREVEGLQVEAEAAEAGEPQEAAVVSLRKALEIAALNSREYQTQREALYLTALALTLQRYEFAPQWFGVLSGDYDNTDLGEEEQVSGDTAFGLSWLFSTGTRVSASLGTAISQYLTGNPRKASSSILDLTVTQPLLQGAGIAVTEPLTQAERDVIYQMRDFVQFRRSFFVRVLSDYYDVLRERQVVRNEELNYQNLVRSRERAEWLGRAGEIAEFEVDRFRQDELRAEDRLQSARQRYRTRLDAFKITLGLPTETMIVLDPDELTRLTEEADVVFKLEVERAVQIALKRRLDLVTAQQEVEDAERKVEVAANDLLPGLDLSASLSTDTEGPNNPTNFQADRTDLSAGFEVDLPLDKKSERNQYRSRLITLERRRRDLCEARDRVVQEVRDAWRQFTRAQRSYEIQRDSVTLAERRVESAELRLQAGRAEATDLLDAQERLVQAQNDVAQSLVDYTVARLALARDMEILGVGPTGQLEENFNEYQ